MTTLAGNGVARFRRRASMIEAIRLDGSEASLRAVMEISDASVAVCPDAIEVVTPFGRRRARVGQWVTRDTVTGALRVADHAAFLADHEIIG